MSERNQERKSVQQNLKIHREIEDTHLDREKTPTIVAKKNNNNNLI